MRNFIQKCLTFLIICFLYDDAWQQRRSPMMAVFFHHFQAENVVDGADTMLSKFGSHDRHELPITRWTIQKSLRKCREIKELEGLSIYPIWRFIESSLLSTRLKARRLFEYHNSSQAQGYLCWSTGPSAMVLVWHICRHGTLWIGVIQSYELCMPMVAHKSGTSFRMTHDGTWHLGLTMCRINYISKPEILRNCHDKMMKDTFNLPGWNGGKLGEFWWPETEFG